MSIVEETARGTGPSLTELDRDTQRSLRAAARSLTREFAGIYDTETIEHLIVSHHAQLASHARITKFLPLLAERSVRDRLRTATLP